MRALLGNFNQVKAFSVIVETDGSFAALLLSQAAWLAAVTRTESPGAALLSRASNKRRICEDITIMEKDPTIAFWLLKTLLGHYAKQTPKHGK